MLDVETIYDSQHKRRVIIFRRADGTYGFFEEHCSEDPFEHCWIPSTHDHTECICDTPENVYREVYGRVSWLTKPSDEP